MLWVLKRTVSMRRFFWAPKHMLKIKGKKILTFFTLKMFGYINLCIRFQYKKGDHRPTNPWNQEKGILEYR